MAIQAVVLTRSDVQKGRRTKISNKFDVLNGSEAIKKATGYPSKRVASVTITEISIVLKKELREFFGFRPALLLRLQRYIFCRPLQASMKVLPP